MHITNPTLDYIALCEYFSKLLKTMVAYYIIVETSTAEENYTIVIFVINGFL